MTEQKNTGTTTVGIVCKDCIVLAADTRATAGGLVLDDDMEKVLPISSHMAVTVSGHAAAAQLLHKHIKAQIKLHELRVHRSLNVKETANLISGFNFSIIRGGSINHMILGGVDKHGPQLFDVFPDGSVGRKTKFHASGSGMMFALGVLENGWNEGMSESDGLKLAEKAIQTAILRDTASGNGLNIFVVDKHGLRKEVAKRVDNTFQ